MSFDAHKILVYAWPPTHMLPSARFSADLKQLQNRDFSTSNRSKPIGVLTRTKCSCSDDRLPISFLLSDFQPNRRNFLYSLPLFSRPCWKGVDTLVGGGGEVHNLVHKHIFYGGKCLPFTHFCVWKGDPWFCILAHLLINILTFEFGIICSGWGRGSDWTM